MPLASRPARAACLVLVLASSAGPAVAGPAGCPAAERLRHEYGIGFGGFEKPLPRAAAPAERPASGPDTALISLVDETQPAVPDGFRHLAFVDRRSGRGWILRTGGFAPVHEWYGPVAVQPAELDGCRLEGLPPGHPARPAGQAAAR